MKTTIVNKKINPDFDIDISRGTKWGNPFRIGPGGTRAQVIQLYRRWIGDGDGKHLLADLHELRGRRLGCTCKPNACHGDVLVKLIYAKHYGFRVHVPRSGRSWAYCAGGEIKDGKVYRAPITMRYMEGWTRKRVKEHCDQQGWTVVRTRIVRWRIIAKPR